MNDALIKPSGNDGGSGAVRRAGVLICGGGISGLALATWLRREGIDAQVLERGERAGGVIATLRTEGFLFERGPNTMLDKHPSLEELIGLAGLAEEAIRIPMRTQTRHIRLHGRLHEVPTGPAGFLGSALLSASAKCALLREPWIKPVHEDEPLAAFVRRRLGGEWLHHLITPMVSGIWAGNPETLSTGHAFPVLKELEREHGSLLRGALRRMRRRQRTRAERGERRDGRCMISFREGLQRLPEALEARLGGRCQTRTEIASIEPVADGGWCVRAEHEGRAQAWLAERVVIAAEAWNAAAWLERPDPELAATLRGFPYNRLTAVSLGIRTDEANLPHGFGFLVARGEGVRMLGAIAASNFLPDRAPAGCAALSIFVGGELDPAGCDLNDEELLACLREDLRRTIGWRGEPAAWHVERRERAIPQYDMGHGLRMRAIEAAEQRRPGLYLTGNWRGGVSIADRVECARRLAAAITAEAAGKGTPER